MAPSSGTASASGQSSGTSIDSSPCLEINYRRNQQGVCIPVEKCCLDNSCSPLIIAKPVYKTKVKTIVVPYAVFKRYPYSVVQDCPEGFKKVNNRQCIHELITKKKMSKTIF